MQEQILELEIRNAKLQAELDEIKDAMKRQGLGLMRTSKGPSDTMICHDMETEARLHQKETDLISKNITLEKRLGQVLLLISNVYADDEGNARVGLVYSENWIDAKERMFLEWDKEDKAVAEFDEEGNVG